MDDEYFETYGYPPFYEDERLWKVSRHGKGKRYEACVYCGSKPTKTRGGRPVCKMCREMLDVGIKPRG